MLHPYHEASRATLPRGGEEGAPGWELFSLLGGVNQWLEGAIPEIQSSLLKKAVSVYVLYRNVAYSPDDLWSLFGPSMARVSAAWPLSVFGTAENQETVCLTARSGEDGIHILQQSISGWPARLLRTLCFQIDCADNDTAAMLARLLSATHWETNVIALSTWQDAPFLREQELLLNPTPQGLFCYGSVCPEVPVGELLSSLDFGQKLLLWRAFLKDGFDPAEFTWLSEAIAKDELDNRLEWELALWEALDQLEFRLVNGEKSFSVYDGAGQRLYFGADGGSAAKRVFLKMLFPLND